MTESSPYSDDPNARKVIEMHGIDPVIADIDHAESLEQVDTTDRSIATIGAAIERARTQRLDNSDDA